VGGSATGDRSRVLLITDPNSQVPARMELRQRDPRR
jgi:hypothetical protein